MGKNKSCQQVVNEDKSQWIDGRPPWVRMAMFVKSYNRFRDESTPSKDEDDAARTPADDEDDD